MIRVHVVTIREVGRVVDAQRGHGVHQTGNERVGRRRMVHGVHRIDPGDALDPRYGHVVHTGSPEGAR